MRRLLIVLVLMAATGTPYLLARQRVAPVTPGPENCVPYDPATLQLYEMPSGAWMLARADGATFRMFADRQDAEMGLAVFKQHTALCYIGRDNKMPDRLRYIMEYLK